MYVLSGDAAALALVNALRIPKQATSLGGVESLVSLPFNTSQASYTARQRAAIGIHPGCVRLSVGIEDAADLIEYLNSPVGRNPNGGTDWAAVRAANGHPERYRLITFEGAFHGRTLATIAAGSTATTGHRSASTVASSSSASSSPRNSYRSRSRR